MKLLRHVVTCSPGGNTTDLYLLKLGTYDTVMYYQCDAETLTGVAPVHCPHLLEDSYYSMERFFRAGFDHHFFGNHVLVYEQTIDELKAEQALKDYFKGNSIPDCTFRAWNAQDRFKP